MNGFKRFWNDLRGWVKGAILAALIGVVGFFAYPHIQKTGLLTRVSGQASTEISGLGAQKTNVATGTEPAPTLTPAYTPAQVRSENAGAWRHLGIAWNGQIGLIYANGGARTARGSIMAQYGLNATLERQDDYGVLQQELLKFAQAYKNGDKDPHMGANSVVIMGDAGPGFMASLQPKLDELGLHAVVIGAPGRSYGEDKCMGPVEWADSSQKAKGGVIAGVLRDGDIHICLAWAQANNVKVNPDSKTWDPDALNFFATNSFTDADQAYIAHTCEDRPVVKNGKGTGQTKNVCVDGTATWTPGDVNVLQSKGGVVSLLSTKENGAQMFSTIIVIKEWARENPATVTNFLKAALDGAATVANDRSKLRQAACASAQVWKEQDCDYWEKYYYGRMEDSRDTGRQVRLGGSQALGLASNLEYFLPAGNSVYDRVYKMFGDLDHKLYPAEMPSFPPSVVDGFFLEKIRDAVGGVGRGSTFGTFTGSESSQVASRSYAINFAAGSATILASSYDDLEAILNNVTVGSNLAIEVNGYTSSEGDDATNQSLSEARARAVRTWLVQHAARGLITDERIRVNGYGESNLVLDSSGAENRTASRRVEIRLLGDN
jgi:outer membrane protein OmpA-like peptidoglycan-associated protein